MNEMREISNSQMSSQMRKERPVVIGESLMYFSLPACQYYKQRDTIRFLRFYGQWSAGLECGPLMRLETETGARKLGKLMVFGPGRT